jgi:Na+-transporting methylmalonyl-CoA/oxaloacetate decarboxylase gamma subunit
MGNSMEDNSNLIGLLVFIALIAVLIWAISFAIRSSRPKENPSDEWMKMKQREFDEWLKKNSK